MFITPEAFSQIISNVSFYEVHTVLNILDEMIKKFERELNCNAEIRNGLVKLENKSAEHRQAFYEKHKAYFDYVKSYFTYTAYVPNETTGKKVYSLLMNTNWNLVIGYTGGDFYIEISFPKVDLLVEET